MLEVPTDRLHLEQERGHRRDRLKVVRLIRHRLATSSCTTDKRTEWVAVVVAAVLEVLVELLVYPERGILGRTDISVCDRSGFPSNRLDVHSPGI